MMISRLVMNLRKVNDRERNLLQPMGRGALLFAPSPEIPLNVLNQVSDLRSSGTAFSFDIW